MPRGGIRDAPKLGETMAVSTFGFKEAENAARTRERNKVPLSEVVVRELTMIAEEACRMARDTYPTRSSGGYDDHTRNLRGSIGYSIRIEGKEVAKGGLDGLGSSDGEQAAEAALSKFGVEDVPAEIVIVAGMHYARYVEAKGLNVITFLQPWLDKQMEKLSRDIKEKRI